MNARSTSLRVGLVADEARLCGRIRDRLTSIGIAAVLEADGPGDLADVHLDLVVVSQGTGTAPRLDIAREIKQLHPDTAVIGVFAEHFAVDARRALRAGVDGLVMASDIDRALPIAIAAVRCGLASIPQDFRTSLEAESLSGREKQVLSLLVSGYTNAEIAAKLFLAESTVKSHLSSAYAKLGVRSRRAAATLILDPDEGLGPGILAIAAA